MLAPPSHVEDSVAPASSSVNVRAAEGRRSLAGVMLTVGGLLAVTIDALMVRVLASDRPSAYMDEATFILTGRFLIERGAVYADALDWTYGSYLWSILAGYADIVGGLGLVRLLVALFGVIMVLATMVAAARLAPADPDRWVAALLAGAIMAASPTAIGVGRFGTYDALAGAAFTSGVALLIPGRPRGRWAELLAGAMLLFVAFLAKYIVAVFFPFICLFFLISPLLPPRNAGALARHLVCFVIPLSAACALYFWLLREHLLTLLTFSSTYSDLTSPFPLREYVLERPELWILAALAAIGWPRATRVGRGSALGGMGIVIGFQVFSRADVDFWKHSIYAIFFLAPLAGLALAPAARLVLRLSPLEMQHRGSGRAVAAVVAAGLIAPALLLLMYPQRLIARVPGLGPALETIAAGIAGARELATDERATLVLTLVAILGLLTGPLVELQFEERAKRSTMREGSRRPGRLAEVGKVGRLASCALVTGAVIAGGLAMSLDRSSRALAFYPDLSQSLDAIRAQSAEVRTVLTDDSAVRYYLYPGIPPDRVTDPFAVIYRGQRGIDGYRLAITDRYYDAIVLDGGIGPLGRRIRQELGGDIGRYYERVHALEAPNRAVVEIYRPRESVEESSTSAASEGAVVYDFDAGLQDWGGHPDVGELQPGLNVALSHERSWNGNASLEFTLSDGVSLVGVKHTGRVSRVQAHVYVVPDETAGIEIRTAIMGFDENWQWQDDVFENVLPVGRWAKISWDLPKPGLYHQIGFKLQPGAVRTAYLAAVELTP